MRPAEIVPAVLGSKWVLEAEHLKIGYEKPLLELSLRIRRGQKVGILGANGAGKTTFLKTAAGFLPPVSGTYTLGNQVVIGYLTSIPRRFLRIRRCWSIFTACIRR